MHSGLPELLFNKKNDPLTIPQNKLNMTIIRGTISINMSDIIVYFAMFITTIDKILCFMGPHNTFQGRRTLYKSLLSVSK